MERSHYMTSGIIMSIMLFVATAHAQEAEPDSRVYYKRVAQVESGAQSVPEIVEVQFSSDSVTNEVSGSSFNGVVYEHGTGRFIASDFRAAQSTGLSPRITVSRNSKYAVGNLQDGDDNTFLSLESVPTGPQEGDTQISSITLSFPQAVKLSRVVLELERTSATPTQVQLLAGGSTVRPWQPYTDPILTFPSVVASTYTIQIQHDTEIKISNVLAPYEADRIHRLRFLAQPGEMYSIFADPLPGHRLDGVRSPARHFDDMATSRGNITFRENPFYASSDLDEDGVRASEDNCNQYANPDQADENRNGIGDACEDFDTDSIPNALDNCPDRPNAGQRDTDGDGIGDECDPEESRLTEQYTWVPVAGIGIAGLVLVVLFVLVFMSARKQGGVVSDADGSSGNEREGA